MDGRRALSNTKVSVQVHDEIISSDILLMWTHCSFCCFTAD